MLVFLPFKCVNALTDMRDNITYISSHLSKNDINDVILHEISHTISGDSDHGTEWKKVCNSDVGEYDLCNYRKRFGIPNYIAGNIGNITGIQNLLVDYHLLLAYRKFSQRILGTEGQWEFSAENNTIRLFPVPKGTFPVVVRYIPRVTDFTSPQAREITYRALLARAKEALGHARRKVAGMPTPDGGTLTYDGDQLVQEGKEEYRQAEQDAILHGEPLGIFLY